MECKFVVGQKVVCINDDRNAFKIPGIKYLETGLHGLKKGEIYTIKSIFENPATKNINLELLELPRPPIPGKDWKSTSGFMYKRFAPLNEKKTDISVFQSIVNKINAGDHDNNYNYCLDELFETVKK